MLSSKRLLEDERPALMDGDAELKNGNAVSDAQPLL